MKRIEVDDIDINRLNQLIDLLSNEINHFKDDIEGSFISIDNCQMVTRLTAHDKQHFSFSITLDLAFFDREHNPELLKKLLGILEIS